MTMLAEGEKHSDIFQSPATYYNPVTCKWQHGTFTLQKNFFEFLQGDTEKGISYYLSFPLQTISSIKKCRSSFIYPSIVIQIGAEMHWFASFPSRDSAYSLLELLWRNCLLRENSANLSPRPMTQTSINTAHLLDEQNQQLDHIQQHVEDLNCELSHSEKMLTLLPHFPNTLEMMKMKTIKRSKYKIRFIKTKGPSDYIKEWGKGYLTVSNNIQIFDDEENISHSIPNSDLVSINILSQSELSLVYIETNGIQSYRVMCPNLLKLQKVLASNPVFQKIVANRNQNTNTSSLLSSLKTKNMQDSLWTLNLNCESAIHHAYGRLDRFFTIQKIITEASSFVTFTEIEKGFVFRSLYFHAHRITALELGLTTTCDSSVIYKGKFLLGDIVTFYGNFTKGLIAPNRHCFRASIFNTNRYEKCLFGNVRKVLHAILKISDTHDRNTIVIVFWIWIITHKDKANRIFEVLLYLMDDVLYNSPPEFDNERAALQTKADQFILDQFIKMRSCFRKPNFETLCEDMNGDVQSFLEQKATERRTVSVSTNGNRLLKVPPKTPLRCQFGITTNLMQYFELKLIEEIDKTMLTDNVNVILNEFDEAFETFGPEMLARGLLRLGEDNVPKVLQTSRILVNEGLHLHLLQTYMKE